jgi:hypothetical protein
LVDVQPFERSLATLRPQQSVQIRLLLTSGAQRWRGWGCLGLWLGRSLNRSRNLLLLLPSTLIEQSSEGVQEVCVLVSQTLGQVVLLNSVLLRYLC